ncbi:MAG: glycine--tRNA ligase, partial [Verrucomicrobiia bacterium]
MTEKKPASPPLMEKIVALCKRRGFVFQSSEIYGGINGFWDYGPAGAELKRNIKDAWWNDVVRSRTDVVGIDGTIITHPRVWEASGHTTAFNDPMVDCRACRHRFRSDQIDPVSGEVWTFDQSHVRRRGFSGEIPPPSKDSTDKNLGESIRVLAESRKKAERAATAFFESKGFRDIEFNGQIPVERITDSKAFCPECGGELTEPRAFNLMFKTFLGPVEDDASLAYLRPETAQVIFAQFNNVLSVSRQKVPFGIAQIGKAFRNEINPRNFTFRSREFEQMEIEYFCRPDDAAEWYAYWRKALFQWYVDLGLKSERLRLRDHVS